MKDAILAPGELEVLTGGMYRTAPFKAVQARLELLGRKWCQGWEDRAGHICLTEEFPAAGLRCTECRLANNRATRKARLDAETPDEYLARRKEANEKSKVWRQANPERVKRYSRLASHIAYVRRLVGEAERFARLADEHAEILADAAADPSNIVFAYKARFIRPPFGGRVKRYLTRSKRREIGRPYVEKRPDEHLADVLREIGRIDPKDVAYAKSLGEDDDRVWRLTPHRQAQLERIARNVLKQSQRERAAMSPEARAAIKARRDAFLRSLLLITEDDWFNWFAAYDTDPDTDEIDVHGSPPGRPHPDALKLTEAEHAALQTGRSR